MLARMILLAAFLATLLAGPVDARQGDQQGKDLIETRSAEPTGQSLYTNSHALIVGINSYPNLPKPLQLQFGVNDANAMRDMLVQNYGFPASEVVVLTNEKATLDNIRKELSSLASTKRVKADDRIVVYFSGHGQTVKLPTGGDMGFLIPSDAKIDLNDPSDIGPYLESCLPMKQVWEYLSASPAKHACVIADACFSGMMANSRSLGMSANTVAAMLAVPARQVLTAGSTGQKTFERQDLGHGVFTYKLLEELKARAADKGKVFKLMDLYMALSDEVSNMTGGKQVPQFGNVETEGQVLFCSGTALSGNSGSGAGTGTGTGGQSTSTGGTGGNVQPPANTRASMTITSNPPGATLYIDGVKKGVTPQTIQFDLKNVQQQDFKIRLEAKGYIPAETTQTLKQGDDVAVPIDLKPVPQAPPPVTTATIAIDSNPPGANVLVDGTQVGATPYTHQVDLGAKKQQTFKIRVELDGYIAGQTSATVKRGDTVSVPFTLKPVPVKNPNPPKQRRVKPLSLTQVATLGGNIPVNSIMFSPDAKQLAISGMDYSLTLCNTNGGSLKKIEAPKNTIVRITPDWKKILFIKLLTDGQRTWVSVQAKDAKSLTDLGAPVRIDMRPSTGIEDVYVGNGRLIVCGSIGAGDAQSGFLTVADFAKGEASTLTGGFRINSATSSADDSTYAAYMEPSNVDSSGSVLVIPSDLSKPVTRVATDNCNSAAELELSADGGLVAVTGQRQTHNGVQLTGTRLYDTASGSLTQTLPAIRVAAIVGKGSRLLGWRTQIGGPIVELLDAKTGDGLGETPGGEVWLSRDEKLAAQASPEGVVTVYRLTQP
ncbi:MAG: PEGA domain-containing protein [Fimbriimonadales bacterium]